MAAGHAHGDADREDYDDLLNDLVERDDFRKAVGGYTRTDEKYSLPFIGGSSKDGKTIYFDRRFAKAIDRGQVKYDGESFDPRQFIRVHESVEGAAIRLFKWPYEEAHAVARQAERHAIDHAGLDWDKYQAALKPWVRAKQKGNVPPDLIEAERGEADEKVSKRSVHYREGDAQKHCGNCSMYADHACSHVAGLILPTMVCDDWDAKAKGGEDEMADLTNERRRDLPSSSFGLPGERKYPMPDRSHAANAKARATQQYNAGRLSKGQEEAIDRKANAKLKGGEFPNPAQAHPRMHALTMAAATHLHNAGHLPAPQAARIKAKAKASMNAAKAAQPFGSLAPDVEQR